MFARPSPQGDFPAFYREHERRVRSLLFSLAPRGDVDDLVQLVFVRCWMHRGDFEGRSKESTWVIRIAMNIATDHWRQSKAGQTTGMENAASIPDERGSNAVGQADARMLLEIGLRELSFEHRAVLVLHYFQDLSLAEIGESLGEPLGTVKSRLHYAKQQVKKRLGEAELEP